VKSACKALRGMFVRIPASIIEELKLGKEEAFNEVYYKYHKLIFYIIYTMVNSRTTTEDLLQESFIKMFEKVHQLNNPSTFHYWFIQLAKNITKNYLRKESKHLNQSNIELETIEDESTNLNVPIFEFNGYLNNFENYVVTLHFVFNYSFKQISEETGQSMSIVTKAFYVAKKKIKKYYEGTK